MEDIDSRQWISRIIIEGYLG